MRLCYTPTVMAKKPKKAAASSSDRPLSINRKASFDYEILETVEAGLVLLGTEIKALREGRVNLREGYARIDRGEAWLINTHIGPYSAGNMNNHEPMRDRKLLLHRRQIDDLMHQTKSTGLTLVPLRLYIKRRRAKVLLGLARGKRQYDNRQAITKRDVDREIQRSIGTRRQ